MRFQVDPKWAEWSGIKCPFHSDSNASAGLNFKTKVFNCLGGCGSKSFIRLAQELGIEYEGFEVELEDTTDWLNNLITEETPPKRTSLKNQAKEYADFLLEKQIKPETIEALGGYYVSDMNNQDYGNLVIPYGQGKFHRRRILGADRDTKFKQSRNEASGDNKSLFGQIDRKWDSIILCEGVTDYCTIWQAGIQEVCCSFGASVSESQMYLLRGRTVFILFDRDYAGYKGAKRASEILRGMNANPIILEIPEEFGNGTEKIDANSAWCHSGESFLDWLRQSVKRYSVFDSDYISDYFLANRTTVKYVSSGIAGLDGALSGGFATGLHAIAGMPEAGKSTFKSYITDTFLRQDQRILSLDYELTKEQNYARLASRHSYFLWPHIEKNQNVLEPDAKDYLREISSKLRIENGWDIHQIKAAAKNFDVIIVDYIQRMPFDGDDERAGIKRNARELSNLTRDGKIVILISSIPRSMYEKTGKNVFKETGDIEYICQSGYILSKILKNCIELKMIKNTRGECKDIYLETDYGHQKIREMIAPNLAREVSNE